MATTTCRQRQTIMHRDVSDEDSRLILRREDREEEGRPVKRVVPLETRELGALPVYSSSVCEEAKQQPPEPGPCAESDPSRWNPNS